MMDDFTRYKSDIQARLKDAGWSNRGIFHAFRKFRVAEAHRAGEPAEAFATRIDRDAPLGMAK